MGTTTEQQEPGTDPNFCELVENLDGGRAVVELNAWVPLDASCGMLPRRRAQPLPPPPPPPSRTPIARRRRLPVLAPVQRALPIALDLDLPITRDMRAAPHHHLGETESVARMSQRVLRETAKEYAVEIRRAERERPRDVRECLASDLGAPGSPCPWVGCSRNTLIDVGETGSIKFRYAVRAADGTVDVDWDRVRAFGLPTCMERVDPDGMTMEDLGAVLGVTRERIRQLETIALARLREVMDRDERAALRDCLAALDERADVIGAQLPSVAP